jgi:hypothetical protein
MKTFPLRGIKDTPPYLHDGCCPKDYGRAYSERIPISRAILTELGILGGRGSREQKREKKNRHLDSAGRSRRLLLDALCVCHGTSR